MHYTLRIYCNKIHGGTLDKIEVAIISILGGIITVIAPNNKIEQYRQNGIDNLSREDIGMAIADGILHPKVLQLPTLPQTYNLSYNIGKRVGEASSLFEIPSNNKKERQ